MAFSNEIREQILVDSARHCAVCHRYKGIKIEVHHIVPEAEGGLNTSENAICLCFDCHSEAGHYNPKHPKGTKFSRSELKKHKEAWIKIVQENRIALIDESSNILHVQYYVCMQPEIARMIIDKKLENFPLSQALLMKTPVLAYQTEFFSRAPQYFWADMGTYANESEYLLKHPDATKDTTYYPSYHYVRNFKVDDWTKLSPDIQYLLREYLQAGGLYEDFLSITAYILGEDVCGGDSSRIGQVEEHMHINKPFFLYATLTNVSKEVVQVKELELTDYSNDTRLTEKLPPCRLMPGHSIIAPLGQFLEHSLENTDPELGYSPERPYYTCRNKANSTAKYFGVSVFLRTITFETIGSRFAMETHSFNNSSVLYIDNDWGMGSCPHAFLINSDSCEYLREIIPHGQETIVTDELIIPADAEEIVIVELEDEVTHFSEVKRNGNIIFKNVCLQKGDFITIHEVKRGEQLSFFGFYQPFRKSNYNSVESRKLRNSIIVKWMENKRLFLHTS